MSCFQSWKYDGFENYCRQPISKLRLKKVAIVQEMEKGNEQVADRLSIIPEKEDDRYIIPEE